MNATQRQATIQSSDGANNEGNSTAAGQGSWADQVEREE